MVSNWRTDVHQQCMNVLLCTVLIKQVPLHEYRKVHVVVLVLQTVVYVCVACMVCMALVNKIPILRVDRLLIEGAPALAFIIYWIQTIVAIVYLFYWQLTGKLHRFWNILKLVNNMDGCEQRMWGIMARLVVVFGFCIYTTCNLPRFDGWVSPESRNTTDDGNPPPILPMPNQFLHYFPFACIFLIDVANLQLSTLILSFNAELALFNQQMNTNSAKLTEDHCFEVVNRTNVACCH